LAQKAQSPGFTFKNYAQHEYLFMRWKEYFLVPDHKVKTITGASFEGFYYICFNQSAGSVTGIYFHSKSEKWVNFRVYRKLSSNITLDTSNWNLSMSRTGVVWERWSFDERLWMTFLTTNLFPAGYYIHWRRISVSFGCVLAISSFYTAIFQTQRGIRSMSWQIWGGVDVYTCILKQSYFVEYASPLSTLLLVSFPRYIGCWPGPINVKWMSSH